ncbi:hypothetical protein EYF80_019652 [Liparis tanakae]|uniref:Uncharacterized protein n=1 Tax=Liparis tanakae TaxID=230148 RepID=A0A4Z2HX61_9TELE|nr:hypothetical protein EYF80_019652 [Liparis tanakae]
MACNTEGSGDTREIAHNSKPNGLEVYMLRAMNIEMPSCWQRDPLLPCQPSEEFGFGLEVIGTGGLLISAALMQRQKGRGLCRLHTAHLPSKQRNDTAAAAEGRPAQCLAHCSKPELQSVCRSGQLPKLQPNQAPCHLTVAPPQAG